MLHGFWPPFPRKNEWTFRFLPIFDLFVVVWHYGMGQVSLNWNEGLNGAID